MASAVSRPADDSASALSAAAGAPKNGFSLFGWRAAAPPPPSPPPPARPLAPQLQQLQQQQQAAQQFSGHLMLLDMEPTLVSSGSCLPQPSPPPSPQASGGGGSGRGSPAQAAQPAAGGRFTPPSDYLDRADRTVRGPLSMLAVPRRGRPQGRP